jgi:hypothetical protein
MRVQVLEIVHVVDEAAKLGLGKCLVLVKADLLALERLEEALALS